MERIQIFPRPRWERVGEGESWEQSPHFCIHSQEKGYQRRLLLRQRWIRNDNASYSGIFLCSFYGSFWHLSFSISSACIDMGRVRCEFIIVWFAMKENLYLLLWPELHETLRHPGVTTLKTEH